MRRMQSVNNVIYALQMVVDKFILKNDLVQRKMLFIQIRNNDIIFQNENDLL